MIVVLLLVVATAVFRGLGALGVEALASWQDAARWGLALVLAFTASAHFTRMRADLVRMVPPPFPRPELLVTLTGIAEALGAVGILVPQTRSLAGGALIALFAAMLPANVSAAQRGLTLGRRPVTPLWIRVPMQLLFIGIAWWTTRA
jgi:uncharacterized membrane protein